MLPFPPVFSGLCCKLGFAPLVLMTKAGLALTIPAVPYTCRPFILPPGPTAYLVPGGDMLLCRVVFCRPRV